MGEQDSKRVVPLTDLDFNFMTTQPVWGDSQVNQDLQARLKGYFAKIDTDGTATGTVGAKYIEESSLWGLLGSYTRDMRLANLSYMAGEMQYCQYYLDLANDFLQANMIHAFLTSLSRVATVLELSQSKGGFLRKRMGTFTQETHKTETIDPPKRTLMGRKKEG